ncbi:hypothetical protein ACWPKO_16440 [Coraliomargarita sp. W4R53]
MNKKILVASAFLAASSFSTAEIVVNDFLSFEGFVDMSYVHADADGGSNISSESENSFQLDQVEISWLFDFDTVTAQVDLQYEGDTGTDTIVEQAFVTYHLDNGGAITAGRYASMLGFEAFEPTGLYQYSTAYTSSVAWGGWDFGYLPTYSQGVKYTYEGDSTFFGISVQDQAFGVDSDRFGGDNESSYAAEVAGSIYFDNGLTLFLGGAYEDSSEGDAYVINSYVTFETGAWLFAAELNYVDKDEDSDAFGESGYALEGVSGLLMANFAYSDQASVTGRVSFSDNDWTNYDDEFTIKYTTAHNYAFTENLLLVTELSFIDYEYGSDSADDESELSLAVELLFSF